MARAQARYDYLFSDFSSTYGVSSLAVTSPESREDDTADNDHHEVRFEGPMEMSSQRYCLTQTLS